jgi:hypothetical protein
METKCSCCCTPSGWKQNVAVVAHHQDVNKIKKCFSKQNEDKIGSNIKASSSSCARNFAVLIIVSLLLIKPTRCTNFSNSCLE